MAVIFAEAHRTQFASNILRDQYNIAALQNIGYRIKGYLRRLGPSKDWKHSTRGFDH